MRNTHPLTWAILGLFVITGCSGDDLLYEQYQDMPSNVWAADKAAEFQVEVNDTINPYDLYINVRNTTDYAWSNLYLFLKIEFPDGSYTRDTLELKLAEGDGKWTGKESGSMVNNNFFYREISPFIFREGGTYTFTLEQGMREEALREVSAVGISLKRAGND